jgi:hypothetical protein
MRKEREAGRERGRLIWSLMEGREGKRVRKAGIQRRALVHQGAMNFWKLSTHGLYVKLLLFSEGDAACRL